MPVRPADTLPGVGNSVPIVRNRPAAPVLARHPAPGAGAPRVASSSQAQYGHTATTGTASRSNDAESSDGAIARPDVGGRLAPVIRSITALIAVLAVCGPSAAAPAWQPSPGHVQAPIWPSTAAAGRPGQAAESTAAGGSLVAGRPWLYVRPVSQPTLTIYSPRGKNTGAAVIVFPGGGYQILAIDLEGTEVCDWLTSKGITCVLLKYRVPHGGPSWQRDCNCMINPKPAPAVQDAQRALGRVRLHAAEWHIDPHKIGVLGFSAGGHLVAAISNDYRKRSYPAVDDADKTSCRPDFAVAVYPGHLWMPG